MTKYTIEIHHVDEICFDTTTILRSVSYLKLLELYALIMALKFPTEEIMIQIQDHPTSKMCIEDFIVNTLADRLIAKI